MITLGNETVPREILMSISSRFCTRQKVGQRIITRSKIHTCITVVNIIKGEKKQAIKRCDDEGENNY